MTECAVDHCSNQATAIHQWGSDRLPFQEAALCQKHADELWDTLGPLCAINHCWGQIVPIEKSEEKSP